MNLELLEELGLSKGQIAVYRAVLELGTSGLNGIQEKTGIERRNIYDILNKLIEKGLISYTIEKGKRTYQCTHPNQVANQVKERQVRLKELQDQLPSIQALYAENKQQVGAEVYRGVDAIKSLMDESLDADATYWVGGNSGIESIPGLKNWFKHWMQRRIDKKRWMYDLVDEGTFLEGWEPHLEKNLEKEYYRHAQLPKDLQSPMVIFIFGNKVAQILWSQQPFAFVLESEEIKESFMRYFNYFWPGEV